jgi:hypothetical protein
MKTYQLLSFWLAIMLSCQTDTASVLSEAIEYIKFLHEQVKVSDQSSTNLASF